MERLNLISFCDKNRRCPQVAPSPQDASKTFPRRPKTPLRLSKTRQEASKTPQNASQAPQKASKKPQKGRSGTKQKPKKNQQVWINARGKGVRVPKLCTGAGSDALNGSVVSSLFGAFQVCLELGIRGAAGATPPN